MRFLVTLGVGLCLLPAIASRATAQQQDRDWIEFSPPGESFHVSLPNQPQLDSDTVGPVTGSRYVAASAVATYTIWSIKNSNYRSDVATDAYLDTTAELLWNGLLKSAREHLDEKARRSARMTYIREVTVGDLAGREYALTVGHLTGTTEFFVAREHIYVMLAMAQAGVDWPRERFFSSFRTSLAAPVSPEPSAPGLNGGNAEVSRDPSDYNRIFTGREVSQKARVLKKPEPTYTESARIFGVEGTVVLRAVFAKNGEVTNLHVVSKLPHGLTERAINAARNIKFIPAMKDDHPVSMWMELQYNFSLY